MRQRASVEPIRPRAELLSALAADLLHELREVLLGNAALPLHEKRLFDEFVADGDLERCPLTEGHAQKGIRIRELHGFRSGAATGTQSVAQPLGSDRVCDEPGLEGTRRIEVTPP
jgi:hypothetical protein